MTEYIRAFIWGAGVTGGAAFALGAIFALGKFMAWVGLIGGAS